ncbi:META domain-containing protein [Erwinia sp. QL-Z3]|jgi:heat shock protein HslJ|uniref:META domain-containing protein n=1 Tax=Erwinia sp. QL-Z3 TaxID=2547962 RepID=UPI001FD85A20|nr:META domain-containing protein [Erwinia sp. QL-Z3]
MMKRTLAVLTAAMVLGGCSSAARHDAQASLANRNFVLTTVDGQSISAPQGMKPGINFSDEMRVTGVMCNRFFGQGTLKDNVLSVPQMASTRMMCSDPKLNQWEMAIGKMLTAGATVKLEQNTLTLTGAGHSLVYRAQ